MERVTNHERPGVYSTYTVMAAAQWGGPKGRGGGDCREPEGDGGDAVLAGELPAGGGSLWRRG